MSMKEETTTSRFDLKRMYDDIPVGLMVADPNGRILEINQYCVNLVGWETREEAIGANSFDINADPEHMDSIVQRLKENGRLENELVCIKRKDGGMRWLRNSIIVRLDEKGEIEHFESTFLDVTREQQYLILLDLQRQLTDTLNHSSDAGEACKQVLSYCTALPGVDVAGVYLLDEEEKNLVLEAHTDLSEDFYNTVRTESAAWLQEMFPDLGVQKAHASTSGYREELVQAEGIKGIVCAFIVWNDKLIGSVNLTSKTMDEIPDITVEFLELMTDNIASHLYRLRQMRVLERQELFYRTMFRESPMVTANLDLSESLRILKEHMAKGVDLDVNDLLYADSELQRQVADSMRLISMNRECVRMLELSTEDAQNIRPVQFMTEETTPAFCDILSALYSGRSQHEVETVVRTGRGNMRSVFMRTVLVPGNEDSWSNLLLSMVDITVLTETINAMREVLLYNRGLLLAIPDMYIVLDEDLILTEFKQPLGASLFIAGNDLVGKSFEALELSDEENVALKELINRTQQAHRPHYMRWRMQAQEGERIFDARMAPLGDSRTLILARDITESERLMQRRLEAEANLLRNLQLQEVLSDVSRGFNRHEGFNLESQMKRMGFAMNLDAVSLFLGNDDGTVSLRNGWVSDPDYTRREHLQALRPELHAWWMSKMIAGETVLIEDIAALVETASNEQSLFAENGLRALIGMPVNLFGRLRGFVTFGMVSRTHKWTHQEEQALRIFTELITNWLTREETTSSLRESEEQFRNLAEQSPNMIFINQNGRVVYANKECERRMGYTREEFYAETFDFMQLIHPSSRLLVRRNFLRHQEGEELTPYEYRMLRKDGTQLDGILSSKLISYGGNVALMGIITDISARKSMERQLRRINEDLEQFVYVASHDLQEPLRGISSYMDLLQERYSDKLDDKGKLFIERAGIAAERLQGMIDGLLAYSRITRHDMPDELVDLDKVLDDVLSTSSKLQQAVKSRDKLPQIYGDASQLQSVLRNLISNAVKYCEREPEIRIEVQTTDIKHVISIHDNGIGIDREYHEEIFDIFRRLHPYDRYPGSGIGLATCLKVIERHGGLIRLASQPGEGSTFIIELPIATPIGDSVTEILQDTQE